LFLGSNCYIIESEMATIGPKSNWENAYTPKQMSAQAAEAASVVLGIHKKKVKITKSKIRDITSGLAEIAYSLGETNDPEEYAELITEDILEAFKEVEKRQNKKKQQKI
jgi:hypothetical protein